MEDRYFFKECGDAPTFYDVFDRNAINDTNTGCIHRYLHLSTASRIVNEKNKAWKEKIYPLNGETN